MEKEFVPYELSVKLKALGFDEDVFEWFNTETKDLCDVMKEVKAPLYQQAFRWFRENGKVAEVFSQILPSNKYKWGYKTQGVEGITDGFLTYEEAELACLTKLIEIVEQTKN